MRFPLLLLWMAWVADYSTSCFLHRPVAFERDTADPFGVDAFLESAKAGAGAGEKKRGLDTGDDERRKRQRDD